MKKIVQLILIFVFFVVFSCKEDFLDEIPLSNLSPENTLTTSAGLQGVLDGALFTISRQMNFNDGGSQIINQNLSDASVVGSTDKQDAYVDLSNYATPLNYRIGSSGTAACYKEIYESIKNCNTICDYIDLPSWGKGINDPERNHLLGSAYFLRAFLYMQATMEYGNVAFPLTLIKEGRQDFKAFHMQGIWDQMIADLEWAKLWVKRKSQLPVGQVPVDAVKILLAKYYMLNERFSDAETLMNEVINDLESRLFTDNDVNVDSVRVGNNFNPFNGEILPGLNCNQPADAVNLLHQAENSQRVHNPEGIWVSPNAPFLEGTQGRCDKIRVWGPNYVSPNKGIKAPPVGNVPGMWTSQDEKSKQLLKWGRGQGFARPTNYAQYEVWNFKGETDRQDYRHKRGNWFEMDMLIYDNPDLKKGGNEWYGKPLMLWYNGVLLCEDTIRCWYGYPMYKFYAENKATSVASQSGGETDIYIIREAEAYLLRAEARFWQGNYVGAAEDLNIIRGRANAKQFYTAADVQKEGIGTILDERCRELYGEEYRHNELVRISIIFAKTGKQCYNGKTYSWDGHDMEVSLSKNSFYYDRMIEKNNFFREQVAWATYPTTRYRIEPKHIFWPIYQPYIIGNVGAILNQTTGYDGSENNIEPLTHIVQNPGVPNVDPMEAIGER